MEKISILYMSGADISIPLFKGLAEDPRFNIVGLLSFPDKAQGRGQKIETSPLKQCAQGYKIPLFLSPEDAPQADIALSFAYGAILAESFLEKFPYALNVHTSLLPAYRGASPIQEAILQGDRTSGLSLITMVKEMDAGPIWSQHPFSIAELHAGQVFNKMAEEAARCIPDDLYKISTKELSPTAQTGASSYCHKIHKNHGFVFFEQEEHLDIEKKFLAYTPWPGLWSLWNGKRVKWLKLKTSSEKISSIKIIDKTLCIPCKNGTVHIQELQLEGKKAMDIVSFQQGYAHLLEEKFLENIK